MTATDPYGLGDENTQPTPPVPEPAEPNPLVHGLGTAGDDELRIATEPHEDGLEFGLGSENSQDTPPAPRPDEPDPLRHGLESAEDTIE
jgi:hypothetical protein